MKDGVFKINLEVIPLQGGFLPLPAMKISKYSNSKGKKISLYLFA